MCKLCTKYGHEPIEDESVLKEAIAEISRAMELQPSSIMHYSGLLDQLLDGRDLEAEVDADLDLGYGNYDSEESY